MPAWGRRKRHRAQKEQPPPVLPNTLSLQKRPTGKEGRVEGTHGHGQGSFASSGRETSEIQAGELLPAEGGTELPGTWLLQAIPRK